MFVSYDKSMMTRVFVADGKTEERSALRLLLLDLKMDIAGEASDWPATLAQAPVSQTDMLLIDWDLLPNPPTAALDELRRACPAALVIVLISHLDARQQAASLRVRMRLSVKVRRPTVWLIACGLLPPAFVLDDPLAESRVLNPAHIRCPERRRKNGTA